MNAGPPTARFCRFIVNYGKIAGEGRLLRFVADGLPETPEIPANPEAPGDEHGYGAEDAGAGYLRQGKEAVIRFPHPSSCGSAETHLPFLPPNRITTRRSLERKLAVASARRLW